MKPVSDPSTPNAATNRLVDDVSIEGTLRFQNQLEFEGKLKGEVHSTGTLIVGKSGFVDGEVNTHTLIIFGKVRGNLKVKEKCILKSTGALEGDIEVAYFSIEEGAAFNGNCSISR